jgi:tripartite-type tricarboxylate transporter receptor subunit TctC
MIFTARGLSVTFAMALACTQGVSGSATAQALPQVLPEGTIEIIVPFTAGGGVDVMGRLTADILSRGLDRSFIVVNRPGANSNIGNQYVARAKPDGRTLLVSSVGLSVNKALYKNLSYDPVTGFSPISLISNAPLGLFVSKSVPVKTLAEFIAYLRANPGKLNYASYGVGSSPHLAAELFQYLTKTKMVHVPFTGNGPATMAIVQDVTQVIFSSVVAAGPYVENGDMKALAYADDKRSAKFPDIPTFIEQGVDFKIGTWFALLGPPDLPRSMVDALNAALKKGIHTPERQSIFDAQGAEPVASTPEQFDAFLKAESVRMSALLRDAGIAAQ